MTPAAPSISAHVAHVDAKAALLISSKALAEVLAIDGPSYRLKGLLDALRSAADPGYHE